MIPGVRSCPREAESGEVATIKGDWGFIRSVTVTCTCVSLIGYRYVATPTTAQDICFASKLS